MLNADQLARIDAHEAVKIQQWAEEGAVPTIDDWPEPTPLPDSLPPVDAFDPELLPFALRPWVMDIAHRMQCPPDFPAVAALGAVSSLIGARAVIQPKARDDWQVVPNLWGAVIGRPGVKKSPALSEVLRPLSRLQANEHEKWQSEHSSWELERKVIEMQQEANERRARDYLKKGDSKSARNILEPLEVPLEPLARRFVVNDATVEKLGELLQENPWGFLSYRDELYGLLTRLDTPGQEGSRSFYLTSYDGNQGYTFDRIMRGTVHIPRVCLAMVGGIQPGRIHEYVRGAVAGGGSDDGLLQRFGLTVWPDIEKNYVHVDQWPNAPARHDAWTVFERLSALTPLSEDEPVVWRFTPEAQAVFVEWLVPFEKELRNESMHPAVVSHLAKYRKLIPALALIFALIDSPDGGNVVGEIELVRALAWCDYLRTHANRLYAAATRPQTTDAETLLSKIRSGKLISPDGAMLESFTPRQIALKGWTGLGSPEAVRKAADLLDEYDYVRREVVRSGDVNGRGRPSDRYIINPRVFGGVSL
jgi:putative DNA primase/helicase